MSDTPLSTQHVFSSSQQSEGGCVSLVLGEDTKADHEGDLRVFLKETTVCGSDNIK